MQELIKGLRGELINCGCHASSGNECCCDCIWPEHVASKAADLIESQAAEIEKYKALCNQLAYAMEMHGAPFLHHELRYNEALEAWRALK